MRKFIGTFVLLFVLCCPAFAGEMLTPPVAPPPPSPVTSVPSTPEDEVAEPAGVDAQTTPDVMVAQMALSILESLLSII